MVSVLTGELKTVEGRGGQVFFTQGDLEGWLYILVSGKVKMGCRVPDGRKNLFAVLGPSDMLGELCAVDPGPRDCTSAAGFIRFPTIARSAL